MLEPVSKYLVNSFNDQIHQLIDSLQVIQYLFSQPHSISDSIFYVNTFKTLNAILSGKEEELRNIMDGIHAITSGNIDFIRNEYVLLPSNELYEENDQIVNDLYLQAKSDRSFDYSDEEISTIRNIACQCPLAGGNAVYLARGLYAMFRDTIYDDIASCLQAGIVYKKGDNTGELNDAFHFTVFPNPANTTVTISWENSSDEIARYSITNFLGQLIYTNLFKLADKSFTFDSGSLSPGFYELGISISGKPENKIKLIIIH